MVYRFTPRNFAAAIFTCSLISLVLSLTCHLSYTHAASKPRPVITLNIQRGPLGILLSVQGRNFRPGQANISYIDAQHTRGTFVGPDNSNVQVGRNGSFSAMNELLPANGSAGTWTIVVTDAGMTVTTPYQALSTAAPSLSINPASGKPGDVLAFSGSNWLPQGTRVQLSMMGIAHSSLLPAPVVSDKNGSIMGAFHLPKSLDPALLTATIVASDNSGALQAQIAINVLPLSPTPTVSPTPTNTATPLAVPTRTTAEAPTTLDDSPLTMLNSTTLAFILLFAGGVLGLAAIMLVLFMLPWDEQQQRQSKRRHSILSSKHRGDTTQIIRRW